MTSCSVLIIGGSGFVGQHVVSVLQAHAPFVTEIRVLDIVPYRNKLDHMERVPVQMFNGSVTDERCVTEACRGVNVVIHLSAIIDYSMFPDVAKTMDVNVKGPAVVVKVATDTPSVYGYIFCSSVTVHMGKGGAGVALTEDSGIPEQLYYDVYAGSKVKAERLVVEANVVYEHGAWSGVRFVLFAGPSLTTVVIRPPTMYGECDHKLEPMFDIAAKMGGWTLEYKANDARQTHAYVGNVAWGFACATKKLYEQKTSLTGSRRMQSRDIGGEAFIIVDDTVPESLLRKNRYFLESAGVKFFWLRFPVPLFLFILNVIYLCLKMLSIIGVRKNFVVSISTFYMFYDDYIFTGKKATDLLGYTPLFETGDAEKRSIEYYKKIWAEKRR